MAGFRSPLPLLGLGKPPRADGGFRSPLPILGLSKAVPITAKPGVRSLLAFWLGGACAPSSSPTPTPPPSPNNGGGGAYYDWKRDLKPEFDHDDELLELMSMIAPYL